MSIGSGEPPELDAHQIIDAKKHLLVPGFIDLHVHGAVGCEAMDADIAALEKMAAFYAEHGVTAFLATTWTDSSVRISAALEAIHSAMSQEQWKGASLIGAHLEGPYLNAEKCGAQNTTYIRRADRTEATAWLEYDVVRLVALAPEFEENHWLIEECVRRGITVSAAHTSADYAHMKRAVGLGLSQTTHTYNAMIGLHHREPGTVGAVMTMSEISCELIADTIHVHPVAMDILYRTKGRDGIILISDAIRSAGMPDGEYAIDERTVWVTDGVVRLKDGTLAGSTLTMDRALHNFLCATNKPIEKLWQTGSLNAAQAINISDRKGSLEIGKDADLVIVDKDINVMLTMVAGKIVYQQTGDHVIVQPGK